MPRRSRVLAVITRIKWVHIDYVQALEEHFDVLVAWSGEGGEGVARDAKRAGLRLRPLGRLAGRGPAAAWAARLWLLRQMAGPEMPHGIGFVAKDLDHVAQAVEDRAAITEATARCLAIRDQFTNEHIAGQIAAFAEPLL